MQLTSPCTAFLPDGGILPGGSYPVYPTLEVAEDGAVTIVLSERAGRGMTLVEKVEANTDVDFAFSC
jgi:hypothetical protein